MATTLFDRGSEGEPDGTTRAQPLAARMRPRSLDDVVGQKHLVGEGGAIRVAIEGDALRSMLLWGPPGTGKTTLAHVISAASSAAFVQLSAVTAGVKDVRAAIDEARERLAVAGRRTVLFIDEIHRFNKSQQDALLPAVEDGTVVLIGATTENPMFEVNAPLLSRALLHRLHPLSDEDVRTVIERALSDDRGLPGLSADADAMALLVSAADGDARAALTLLETAAARAGEDDVSVDDVQAALSGPRLRYDKAADAHYDQVSAFIKSLRGSDPDAAVYWLVRMLTAGEDPRFLARRMVILASEDIGLAEPRALEQAVAAFRALDVVGLPEARYALAQAAIYLALAPKSNSVYRALRSADAAVERLGNAEVPMHLRDKTSRRFGHGEGYRYPHDDPSGWVDQQYGPDGLARGQIYRAGAHGTEPGLASWRRGVGSPTDDPPAS